MGILYNSVKKAKLHQEKMQKYYIDRLIDLGVTESQLGHSIHALDYDEAKYEYTLAEIRAIDIRSDSNKWF